MYSDGEIVKEPFSFSTNNCGHLKFISKLESLDKKINQIYFLIDFVPILFYYSNRNVIGADEQIIFAIFPFNSKHIQISYLCPDIVGNIFFYQIIYYYLILLSYYFQVFF